MSSDIPSECIDLLHELNAHDIQYFERNILGHLVGTYSVLKGWNVGNDLAIAGLFHAVYLTEFFVSNEPDKVVRQRVRSVIGETPEKHAYRYCVMNRNEFAAEHNPESLGFRDNYSGAFVALTKAEDQQLMELIWANSIEQIRSGEGSFNDHENLRGLFEASRHRVGTEAIREFESLK